MYYPVESRGKIKFALLTAAALAYILQKQRDAVGISIFSDKVDHVSPIKSTRTHLNSIYTSLEETFKREQFQSKTRVAPVLHEIAERNSRRSLVIILSDMFDSDEDSQELFLALQHLKHKKHEVLMFHITDRNTEHEFNFDEKPYEFIDLESGEKMKLTPSMVKENYMKEVSLFYKELKLKCARYKIDFIEADISEDFNNVLRSYFIKRSKMR